MTIKSFLFLALFGISASVPRASAAQQKARPYLIVPGMSIGKVQLAQSQEVVRRKIGKPQRSEKRIYQTYTKDTDWTLVGKLNVDIWHRRLAPNDQKRKWPNGGPNNLEVVYKDGVVVQITTDLDRYKTHENLSVDSLFQQFSKRYGEASKLEFDYDSERQGGGSFYMASFWEFKKYGLTIRSHTYSGGNNPEGVYKISIHHPNQPYMFD